jgi:hypothetical protein
LRTPNELAQGHLISGALSGMILIYAIPEQQMNITMKQFFDMVAKTIAEPHTIITEHDKRRAIRVFLYLDEFMMENVPEYCEEGCEIDFGGYAAGVLDELEGK